MKNRVQLVSDAFETSISFIGLFNIYPPNVQQTIIFIFIIRDATFAFILATISDVDIPYLRYHKNIICFGNYVTTLKIVKRNRGPRQIKQCDVMTRRSHHFVPGCRVD